MRFSWVSQVLAGLLLFVTAQAADFEAPYLSRPVMDEAGVVGSRIGVAEVAIRELFSQTGVQLTVYLPAELRGYDIETFTMTVAEQWKLGKKGQDKGLLLVIAPRERRMRLEVGYGLEGQITDLASRRILDQVLRPYLRDNRTGDGIVAVVGAVAEAVGSSWRPAAVSRAGGRRMVYTNEGIPPGFLKMMFFVFLCLLVFGRILHKYSRPFGGVFGRNMPGYRRRRRTSWGGFGGGGGWGSGSGGGWSGGGGGFGGGGASSNW